MTFRRKFTKSQPMPQVGIFHPHSSAEGCPGPDVVAVAAAKAHDIGMPAVRLSISRDNVLTPAFNSRFQEAAQEAAKIL